MYPGERGASHRHARLLLGLCLRLFGLTVVDRCFPPSEEFSLRSWDMPKASARKIRDRCACLKATFVALESAEESSCSYDPRSW